MKRYATSALVAFLFLAGTAAAHGLQATNAQSPTAVAQATGDEAISVSPEAGTLNTSFSVHGSSFAPGSLMDEVFTDPTGARWQFSDWNTFYTESDGSFAFTYNLGKTDDAASLPDGRWTISYCYDKTNSCSTVDFVIQ